HRVVGSSGPLAAALRFQDGASAAVNINGSVRPIRQADTVVLAAVILCIQLLSSFTIAIGSSGSVPGVGRDLLDPAPRQVYRGRPALQVKLTHYSIGWGRAYIMRKGELIVQGSLSS